MDTRSSGRLRPQEGSNLGEFARHEIPTQASLAHNPDLVAQGLPPVLSGWIVGMTRRRCIR